MRFRRRLAALIWRRAAEVGRAKSVNRRPALTRLDPDAKIRLPRLTVAVQRPAAVAVQ